MHGDIGSVSKKDTVLIISNSGCTAEIIPLLPNLKKRDPNQDERTAIINLITDISSKKSELNTEEYQSLVYKYGKQVYPDNLRDWFIALYEILFGSKSGPRLGSLFNLYKKKKVLKILNEVI